MIHKFITIKLPNGQAKLPFVKKGDTWVCMLPDQTMHDLEAYLEGRTPREIVRWSDLGDLGE